MDHLLAAHRQGEVRPFGLPCVEGLSVRGRPGTVEKLVSSSVSRTPRARPRRPSSHGTLRLRRYEIDCWFYVHAHRPKWVGRSDHFDPQKFPPRSARRSVGRSRPTRFFFAALRAAVQGAVPTLIFLAALCAAVGRSDRSDPKISSPRSARRSVGRTRPTRNRPLAREVGRSVGDAKPTINFVPP